MTIGCGIVGAGTWGEVHAMAYASHPHAELTAVCDNDFDRARDLAQRYFARACYSDYHDLLADDRIQAVSVTTPDFAHAEVAIAAARAGKHMIIEKPLAITVEKCMGIRDEVAKQKVKCMVDFHNRWNPAYIKTRAAIVSGELGALQLISMRLNDTIAVPTEMISWAAKSNVAWFLGSHNVDLMRYLTGSEVKSVYSRAREGVLKKRGIDTPDFFITVLETENGCVGVIENCWIVNERAPSVFDCKTEIIGSDGTLFVDTSHCRVLEKYSKTSSGFEDILGLFTTNNRAAGFVIESINHFINAVVSDTVPSVGIEDGLAVTKVINAMMESAKTGNRIEIA
jgi:predicted dehydrogenase